jgi:hypothetical protein
VLASAALPVHPSALLLTVVLQFFEANHAICYDLVATCQLLLHLNAAIWPARNVALELAGVKTSITFPLARVLADDLCVVKVNQMTHWCAIMATVQTLSADLAASVVGCQFSKIKRARNFDDLIQVNLTPEKLKQRCCLVSERKLSQGFQTARFQPKKNEGFFKERNPAGF